METTHFRHMHNLLRYKTVVLLFLAIIASSAIYGQHTKGNYNYWEFRSKPFYFGLTIGMHSSGYLVDKSSQFGISESINVIDASDKAGLNVNIITNLKIGQYFDFRFIPGFAFSERKLVFANDINEPISNNNFRSEKRIESVFLEIPLLMRFKSDAYKDKRLFVVSGLKYSYDVSSNSRVRDDGTSDNLVRISPHDFQFEVGAGVQFFFPFFIFSPEIKFSQGLGNINIYNGALEESRVVDRLLSRTFSFSMHFEG